MVDEPGPEEKLTVRERRAQHHKKEAIKGAPGKMLRKAIVPAIIILVIAGIGTGMYFQSQAGKGCPGHWHSTFDIYVQEANQTERISFGMYDLQDPNDGLPFRMHMHSSDGKNQLHFEPRPADCMGIRQAFDFIDVDLSSKTMKITGAHDEAGQGGTYRAGEPHNLTVYIQHVSDRGERDGNGRVTTATLEWREHTLGSVLGYQLKDGERLLILYGDYTPDQVAQFQAAMAPVDGYLPSVYA